MNEVDAIRLDQFRQLKKEIRGCEDHMIVGIDVAKDKHHAFFGTVRGETLLKRLVFENNIQGFEKLMSHVNYLGKEGIEWEEEQKKEATRKPVEAGL